MVEISATGEAPALLNEAQAKALVNEFGIISPKGWVLKPNLENLSDIDLDSGPFAMKVISREIIHKSDGGFVALNLTNYDDLQASVEDMLAKAAALNAFVEGFLVEEMISSGHELVVGGIRDHAFGPMIMLGLGGIYIEVFKDVSFRICPINPIDAREMIDELKCKPILQGARGGQSVNLDALCDLLLRVGGEGGLMTTRSDIEELDLNPIIANAEGFFAVDARIKLT